MKATNRLIGALIGLARATDGNTHPTEETYKLLIRGLVVGDSDEQEITDLIGELHAEKQKLVPRCSECASPCGRNDDYDMAKLRDTDPDVRASKALILSGLHEAARRLYTTGKTDENYNETIAKALFAVGEDWDKELLLPVALEVGQAICTLNECKTANNESEDKSMKYSVNENCIGCGLCAATCPEVFSMSGEGVAVAIETEVPEGALDAVAEAKDGCPVEAIEEA